MSIEVWTRKFCNRVCEMRIKENISLEELSKRSGLPLKMLKSLERGVIPMEMMVSDAIDLARVFHCQLYELF